MSSNLKLDLNHFEYILAYQAFTNTSYLADIIDYVKPIYFNSDDIRTTFNVVKEYYKQYHRAPNTSEIAQYLVSDDQKKCFKNLLQIEKN